jgi:hypothetical protein
MSDKKNSDLTAVSAHAATDVLPVVQSSTTKKSTLQAIADWIIQTAASFTQSGTGPNTARTVQAKIREFPASPEDKGAAGDGTTADLTAVNNAIADAVTEGDKAIWLDNDYLVAAVPTNTMGVEYHGPGRILKNVTGSHNRQLNTYADLHKYITGREYLSAFHKKIISRTATTCIFSGDSTTSGTGVDTAYQVHTLFLNLARIDGYYGVTTTNAGHSGDSTVEWLSTYLSTDMGNDPDLYVIRWGINDPRDIGDDLTPAEFIANIRSGLATIRAHANGPQDECSIVLMMPNSVSSTPDERDEKFHEAIVQGMKQAARDYQCCFIDTYAFLQDSRNAADYMDSVTVSSETTHVHPANVMNLWIMGLLAEACLPRGLRIEAENVVRNISGTYVTKDAGDAVSTYDKGITISRANPGGGGTEWPYDGAVITFNHADDTQLQINWSYIASESSFGVRVGQSGTWQDWNLYPDNTVKSWTPTLIGLSTAGTQTYSSQTGYYVRNGNLITAHFRITMTAKDAATSGNLAIGGLPVAASAVMANASGSISRHSNVNLTAGYTQLGLAVPASQSYAQLFQSGDAAATAAVDAGAAAANTEIFGVLSYFV